jgi:hypothetical protein
VCDADAVDDTVPERDELRVVLTELEWDAVTESGSGLDEGEVLPVMLAVRRVSVMVGEAECNPDALNAVAIELCDTLALADAERRGSELEELSVTRRLPLIQWDCSWTKKTNSAVTCCGSA